MNTWLAKWFIKIAIRLNPRIVELIHLGDRSKVRCIVLDTLFAKENRVAIQKAKERLARPYNF